MSQLDNYRLCNITCMLKHWLLILTKGHNVHKYLEATRLCNHPFLRKAMSKLVFQNKLAMLLDWFHGKTIEACGKLSNVKELLIIVREIESSVDSLHKRNMNHLSLTACNVLVNMGAKAIKIIGLASATKCETIRSVIGYHNKRLGKHSKCIPPE